MRSRLPKGSSGDVEECKRCVVAVPRAAAEAHEGGGFIGIDGRQISAEEQAALDEIQASWTPAYDGAIPSDEAEARRYPRDRENFCVCRQRWSSIRRRAIDWARCAASRSPSAAAMIDPFIRMCHE